MAKSLFAESDRAKKLRIPNGKCEGCRKPSWTAYCDRCAPPRTDVPKLTKSGEVTISLDVVLRDGSDVVERN